jgi:hypothetical protein
MFSSDIRPKTVVEITKFDCSFLQFCVKKMTTQDVMDKCAPNLRTHRYAYVFTSSAIYCCVYVDATAHCKACIAQPV